MEIKNYYPLRVGKHNSVIVSDTYPDRPRLPDEREVEYYGGYVIAESVPNNIAQQLVDAYNEKYADSSIRPQPESPSKHRSTIAGQIHWLNSIKKYYSGFPGDVFVRDIIENIQKCGPKEIDFIKVGDIAKKYGVKPTVALAITDEINAIMKPINYPPLSEFKVPTTQHIGDGYRKAIDDNASLADAMRDALIEEIHKEENSVHSVTEGMDVPPIKKELFTVEPLVTNVAEFMEEARIHPRETVSHGSQVCSSCGKPRYTGETDKSDSELCCCKGQSNIPLEGADAVIKKPSLDDQIEWIKMNLNTKELGHAQEAALGMLQAFKKEREKPRTQAERIAEKKAMGYKDLREEITSIMGAIPNRYVIADAIMFALKHK